MSERDKNYHLGCKECHDEGKQSESDADLIARAAEKLGRTPCEPHIGMVWKNKDGDYEDAEDLLLNTDACLALLDENKYFSFSWNESDEERSEHRLWRVFYHSSENAKPIYDKSLPRAILLALLEVPDEND